MKGRFVAVVLAVYSTAVYAPVASAVANDGDVVEIGITVNDHPIIAERFGTPGGPVVLIVGLLHGNEKGSSRVINRIRKDLIESGSAADVWLIRDASPDGSRGGSRTNARGVDLNRNFPTSDWVRTSRGNTYSGRKAGSEPETRALANFIARHRPQLSIWFHQVGPVVDPHPLGDQSIMKEFAKVVGYPLRPAVCRGVCTGTATTFHAQTVEGSTAFVVELPAVVTAQHADRNVAALRAVITMLR